MWVWLAVGSALLLGVYDLLKKRSVHDNAVLPVLFFSCLTGALLWVPVLLFSRFSALIDGESIFFVPVLSVESHLLIVLKSMIVALSWILAYQSLKHIPLSIASPIRSTSPMLTLAGAVLLLGEVLNGWQWAGVLVTITAYWFFSVQGAKEGISFSKNPWIWCMVAATFVGSGSALYDKFLLSRFSAAAVQVWFSVYLVILFGLIVLIFWFPLRKRMSPFQWRWSIPLVGVTLLVADFLYFYALQQSESRLAIISCLRRGSVVISFFGGIIFMGEVNRSGKNVALAGILLGILLMVLGRS